MVLHLHLHLHNPLNQAHIEDLKDRLSTELPQTPSEQAVIRTLIEMVQAMDRGAASKADADKVFSAVCIPGFSFERWLAEMVEEDVYLEMAILQAA